MGIFNSFLFEALRKKKSFIIVVSVSGKNRICRQEKGKTHHTINDETSRRFCQQHWWGAAVNNHVPDILSVNTVRCGFITSELWRSDQKALTQAWSYAVVLNLQDLLATPKPQQLFIVVLQQPILLLFLFRVSCCFHRSWKINLDWYL